MKVHLSIRRNYDEQLETYTRLKALIDKRISSLKEPKWHYESRVKSLESYALKIETGRYSSPILEDFFACMLAVTNVRAIFQAEKIINENFTVIERRPESADITYNRSESFSFDDLRLYVTLPDDPALPSFGFSNIKFEIQIKTFLQHAWSVATHDLVYKTDSISWAKDRIAYQTKAMLEHAEVSIHEVDKLSLCEILNKEDRYTAELKRYIDFLKEEWPAENLPGDVRRLALNLIGLSRALPIDIKKLKAVLTSEKAAGRGTLTLNLSPYAIIIQSLLNQKKAEMTNLLTRKVAPPVKVHRVVIPAEIELPADIDKKACVNAIFLEST